MSIIFWVTAFFASFIGNIAAFGISSILLPVAVSVYPYKIALALTSIFHLFNNVWRIELHRGKLDKRFFLLFGVPSTLFTFLGASMVGVFPETFLKIGLGIVLVTYSLLGLTGSKLNFNLNKSLIILGGSVYGFLSGLLGSGGSLRGAILASFELTGGEYIATNGGISLVTDVTRLSVYLWNSYVPSEYYWSIPLLFIVATLGGFSSKLVVGRIRKERFNSLIYTAVLFASLKMLIESIAVLI